MRVLLQKKGMRTGKERIVDYSEAKAEAEAWMDGWMDENKDKENDKIIR